MQSLKLKIVINETNIKNLTVVKFTNFMRKE